MKNSEKNNVRKSCTCKQDWVVVLAMRNSGIGAFSYNECTLESIHDDS